MYLLSNALKNIVRNKGRYLLIGAVLTVMLISVTVSAMIHFTTNNVIEDYTNRFGVKAYFTPDLIKLIQLGPGEDGYYHDPNITSEQYLAFSESEAVKIAIFQGSRQMYSADLTGLDQGGEENDTSMSGFVAENGIQQESRQAPNILVLGYSDFTMLEDFSAGRREITAGKVFENIGECIISRELADLNQFSIGDSFTLQDVNTKTTPLTLTICGIYSDITTPQQGASTWAVNNRRNEVLTSYATLEQHSMDGLYITAEYYLKSPEYAEAFETHARKNGLNRVYNVNVDNDAYNQVVKPVEGLKRVSMTFLVVVLCLGALVLIFLSVLGVRERKYEIGVLRAMGMEKGKIVFGLLSEAMGVLIVCLCLGFVIGGVVAQPVSNSIMAEQTSLMEDSAKSNYGNIVSSSANSEQQDYSALQRIKVSLLPEAVFFTTVIAILLGFLTNSAAVLYIVRYRPMKILSERS